ncbi:MAG: hypothetical protein JST83_13450 [Bacteroidetes bacterium]|nr:hypothetical protein [Bacteroidota bacterium]
MKNVLMALLMIIGTTLMAQEKYEQAVLSQTSGAFINLAIEGKEFKRTKLTPYVDPRDFTPILKELALMRDEGWEIWNSIESESSSISITYFLRRKIK